MDCEQIRDQLERLSLSPEQSLEPGVADHLARCPSCTAQLREQQEAWSLMCAALPQTNASSALESRLMDRIQSAPDLSWRSSRRTVVLKYAVAASVLVLLVGGTLARLGTIGLGSGAVTDSELEQIRSIAAQMDKLNELERVFATPQLRYVSLVSSPQQRAKAYLVHDPQSKQIHFFACNIDIADSAAYVWLQDDEAKTLSVSRLDAQSAQSIGAAVLSVDDSAAARTALVTLEQQENPTQPSENVVLRCSVPQF